MATVFVPEDRNPWWTDVDGVKTRVHGLTEKTLLTVDFSDLFGGESLSTATATADGVTVSGQTTVGSVFSCYVLGVGDLTVDAATATGKLASMTFRYVELER